MKQEKKQQRYQVWMRRPGSYAGALTRGTSRAQAEALAARITPRQPQGTEVWVEPSR